MENLMEIEKYFLRMENLKKLNFIKMALRLESHIIKVLHENSYLEY